MRFLLFLLLSIAFCAIYALIGGTRLLFAYPSYLILGAAGVLSLCAFLQARSRPNAFALGSMSLLAGYVALRAIYSPYAYYARSDLYMTGACVLVYLLTAFYLTESRERLRLLVLLMIIAVGQVSLALYQFLSRDGFLFFGFVRPDMAYQGEVTRASGMFISPNHFAGYLETVAMFALGFAAWGRSGIAERFTAGAVAALCYVGVAISISRGGMLSSAFSLVVFGGLCVWGIMVLLRKNAPALIALTLAGIFGMSVGIGLFASKSHVISERASKLLAKDIRYSNWAATLDQYREAPVFGTGAGTHLIYGRLYRRPELQSDPIHAHGDYLEMLAEYGLVGLALSGIFLIAHLGCGLNGINRLIHVQKNGSAEGGAGGSPPPIEDQHLGIAIGAFGGIAALLAHSVVDFNMHIPGNALLYAFAFGILANPGGKPHVRLRSLSFSGAHRLAAVAVGGILIIAIIPKIKGAWHTEQARILLRERKFTAAQKHARIAVAAAKENPYAWLYLGEAYRWQANASQFDLFRDRMNEKALTAYAQGLQQVPVEVNLLTRLAQTHDALGRHDDAEATYRKALAADPNLGALYAFYAQHLTLRGLPEEAKAALEKSRALGAGQMGDAARSEYQQILPEAP